MDKVPKYQIGQKVWWAKSATVERSKVCPDCKGTKSVTVVLADYQCFSIPCETCDHKGCFYGPMGYVTYYEHDEEVKEINITGVEVDNGEIRYKTDESWYLYEKDLHDTAEKAKEHAVQLAKKRTEEEENKVYRREKDYKNWAWHVRYYRDQIKEAQKTIERATAKLNYAKTKAKED